MSAPAAVILVGLLAKRPNRSWFNELKTLLAEGVVMGGSSVAMGSGSWVSKICWALMVTANDPPEESPTRRVAAALVSFVTPLTAVRSTPYGGEESRSPPNM